jgi:acyl-CoA synthetase (AMP-forming)/AMP-acid ligase II
MKAKNLRYSNLIEMVLHRAAELPEKVAFIYLLDGESDEAVLTFAELDRQARIIAGLLQNMGVAGERVLLLYAPGIEYITAFLGCIYAGAVAVPTYPPDVTRLERTLPRFLSIVESADPKVALTTSPILGMASMLLTQYPELGRMEWIATDDVVTANETGREWHMPDVSLDTLAFLQYTSGSTAAPKGVMLNHGNLLHNMAAITEAFEIDEENDTAVFWLPFYHDMGLIGGILAPIYVGVNNTLISPLDFLQRPLRWLKAISKYRATVSGGPNFAYDLCVRKVKPEQKAELDLSSWSLAFNGAEPVRASTLERFYETFAECGFKREAFYPSYGLAESAVFVSGIGRYELPLVETFNADELAMGKAVPVDVSIDNQVSGSVDVSVDKRTLVGCGRPRLDHEVVIVDPESMELLKSGNGELAQVGEIWVSGPSIAQGYWNLPKESERVFYARLGGSPEKRYMRTGDLGFIKDGQLFVAGRLKDMIIIDGLNHYPQDIELSVEGCHPALRPGCSAAFSIEENNQERLVIVAEIARKSKLDVLKEQIELDPTSIKTAIRRIVSKVHDLSVYDIVLLKPGTVPKTSSGKIRRQASKTAYLAGTLEVWKE